MLSVLNYVTQNTNSALSRIQKVMLGDHALIFNNLATIMIDMHSYTEGYYLRGYNCV
jgi:hypothetical protein